MLIKKEVTFEMRAINAMTTGVENHERKEQAVL
jgi:hypothetical protein